MTTILPVIHFANENQAMRNAERVAEAGAPGLMLIEMSGKNDPLSFTAGAIKRRWPMLKVGVNRLGTGTTPSLMENIHAGTDATWTDQQLTHSAGELMWEADRAAEMLFQQRSHALFAAVAFKYQAAEPHPGVAARLAVDLGFIPTTSGKATGYTADLGVVTMIRQAIGPEAPLAIASGITPENAPSYAPLVSHMLVATGINASFYEIDPARLRALLDAVKGTTDA